MKIGATKSIDLILLLALVFSGSFFLAWLSFISGSRTLFTNSEGTLDLFWITVAIFSLSCAILRFSCAAFSRTMSLLLEKRFLLPGMSILSTLSVAFISLCCTAELGEEFLWLYCAGIICAILGSILMSTLWVEALRCLTGTIIIMVVSAAYVVSSLNFFFISALPTTSQLVLIAVLPLLFGLSLMTIRNRLVPNNQIDHLVVRPLSRQHKKILAIQPVGIFFCGLSSQIVRASTWVSPNSDIVSFSSDYHKIGILAVSLLLFVFSLLVMHRKESMLNKTLIRIALLLVAVGIFLPGIFSQMPWSSAGVIVGMGMGCLQILLFSYGAILSKSTGMSPFVTFGFTWGAIEIAAFLGQLTLPTLIAVTTEGTLQWSQVALAIVFVLLIVTVVIFFPFSRNQYAIFAPEKKPLEAVSLVEEAFDRVDALVALQETYNLTPREYEVASLLAKGRSLPYIQKELNISAGTANAHLQHIYEKLGIHNRQKFLDLLESRIH